MPRDRLGYLLGRLSLIKVWRFLKRANVRAALHQGSEILALYVRNFKDLELASWEVVDKAWLV